jgi:hypothetical protein
MATAPVLEAGAERLEGSSPSSCTGAGRFALPAATRLASRLRLCSTSRMRLRVVASRVFCRVVLGVLLASLGSGCATVAPHERAKLAHPTMQVAEEGGFAEAHLRAISEGAIGGSSGAGSGCGCN